MATEHHIFEGLTFRNTEIAFMAGEKEVMGAKNLTIRNCRFEDIGVGVWNESEQSADFYIADNLFLGREDRMRLIGWNQAGSRAAGIYPSHQLRSFFAVKVYGPGHVIAHNSIAYFHDAICVTTYGPPYDDPELQASSIDIYRNDIHLSNDDFIESDGGVHNIRVFENRGVNAAHNGYSAQPMFGGPVYFYRNILYHVPSGSGFKLSAVPAGILAYHNTLVNEQTAGGPYSNAHFRNNLFLSRNGEGRGVMRWSNATENYSSDYNGFRPNPGVEEQYTWLAPKPGHTAYEDRSGLKTFRTLADFRQATGQETHGVELDFDAFEELAPPDPAKRHHVYHAMDLNFQLKAGSKAVDAGVVLPTINDNYNGSAPDLGALERGMPTPHYGARWIDWEPFYR